MYINGIGNINASPSSTTVSNLHRCVDPDYKQYLDAIASRRLGRLIKMALVASKECLKEAEITVPDAIITGTGLGCLEDTEKFLNNMLENETGVHSPTSFIQSTHNTISGQIAIMLQCNGYNNTFSHRSLSFERALGDAQLLLAEGDTKNVLLGAADEMPAKTHQITQKIGLFRSLNSKKNIPIAGEGVHYFLCSDSQTDKTIAKLIGTETIQGETSTENLKETILHFLSKHQLSLSEIGTLVLGANEDLKTDNHYAFVVNQLFPTSSLLHFKHQTGEYFTASAFGLVLACQFLKDKVVPEQFILKKQTQAPRTILVYNHFKGVNHSLFLVQDV